MEIKEQIDQLYYELGETRYQKEYRKCTPKTVFSDILNKIIELKKSIGEDYSYDEQLLNQV